MSDAQILRPRAKGRFRGVMTELLHRPRAAFGMAVIAVMVFCAVFAPWIMPHDPFEQSFDGLDLMGGPLPPGGDYLLGTDLLGRDLASRLVLGTRTSLIIGVLANGIAILLGAGVGITAGYFGGWIGAILMRFTDLMMAFPALLLAIAFSASIGGLATLIGTPPNALLAGYMAESWGVEIGFAQWMAVGLPVSLILLVLAWGLLTKLLFRLDKEALAGAEDLLARELHDLGPMRRPEAMVLAVFVATGAAWVLRPLLDGLFPAVQITDPGIAIVAGLLLFAIPAEPSRRLFLLDWPSTGKLPWGVLLLFGGGLSLGAAINDTGLSAWIAQQLSAAEGLPAWAIMVLVTGAVMTVSHLTSNTATAAAFLPLIASLAISLGENPLLLAVPAVMGASAAFMMPVATPPNAIIFASGQLTVADMARAGVWLCLAALVLVIGAAYALLPVVFGVMPGVVPGWAG